MMRLGPSLLHLCLLSRPRAEQGTRMRLSFVWKEMAGVRLPESLPSHVILSDFADIVNFVLARISERAKCSTTNVTGRSNASRRLMTYEAMVLSDDCCKPCVPTCFKSN